MCTRISNNVDWNLKIHDSAWLDPGEPSFNPPLAYTGLRPRHQSGCKTKVEAIVYHSPTALSRPPKHPRQPAAARCSTRQPPPKTLTWTIPWLITVIWLHRKMNSKQNTYIVNGADISLSMWEGPWSFDSSLCLGLLSKFKRLSSLSSRVFSFSNWIFV